ncbi:MAG: helix-turn-helix domain-containing protein [Solirubrobacteraceae bacterium]
MEQIEIGRRIAEARAAKGLTQQQLAEKIGHAVRTIAAWEGNTRHPRTDAMAQIAEALGHPVAWFYAEHPDATGRRAA